MTQYLTTTFALADPEVRDGLERFFNNPEHGVFRGPYLRIRTRYRPAADGWRDHLEWAPGGVFVPHRHQARAFARLSSLHHPPLPTLITTGTGSGKTESFLYPVLDHCRRERAHGAAGIKVLLLYPMNALATDQTKRLDDLLRREEALRAVTAGLYIGDTPESGYERVMTGRAQIRSQPPDILITNYKMLDLLLQRGDDAPLWRGAHLAYVVLDEFHTYDGAQGTDVAMLLRRLAAVAGPGDAETPLRGICPVATSATLGAGGDAGRIRTAAQNAFGVTFDADSVLGEDRLSVEEFIPHAGLDYSLPLPEPRELAALPDPQDDQEALAEIARAVTGDPLTGDALGMVLRKHILTAAVLEVLGDEPRTSSEILDRLPRRGAYNWGAAIRDTPELAATALARFVALLSVATDPSHPGEPLLQIETHLWGRAVTRLLREVSTRPAFAWHGEDPPPPEDTSHQAALRAFLPAVFCRHCGRSGWAALSPEKDPHLLIAKPNRIYRAAPAGTKQHVRPLIAATPAEAADYAADPARPEVLVLDATGGRVRPYDPARDIDEPDDGVFVLANLHHDREGNTAARRDRCPACGDDEGIRFIGTGVAALASVAVTELFTGGELTGADRKTLLFNDSVQDAAHRAGYVANRSYGFSVRALLADGLRAHGDTTVPLNDLIADVVEQISDRHLAAVVPPDLHDRQEIDTLLAGEHPGTQATWNLLAERLAFATVLEFGLRSRQGRTLELTRTVAAEVALRDPLRIATVARDLHRTGGYGGMAEPPELTAYVTYVRGLLERMRRRGGVHHRWLRAWVGRAGTSRFGTIWGERPDGMPAFGRELPSPRFVLTADKPRTEFDRVDRQQSWYADWTARCLGIPASDAPRYLRVLMPTLMAEGVIASRRADDGQTTVYGLKPGHIEVRPLSDAQVNDSGVGCDTCPWTQTVHPARLGDWIGHPCPRYRCGGRLTSRTADFATDYYRRLYTTAEPYTVRTAEHTGTLTRAQRERVERAFLDGTRYSDPNVLSCTPTLELGIDIGDLSSVVLASLPRGPANYVQRAGRAGRRSGNALVLALAGRRARDRYFLADPRDMIAGEIVPPGCYLSAVEILRRQYVAHLLDLAARGELPAVQPLPRLASVLFGPQRWLGGLAAAALERADTLADGFLSLFGVRTAVDGGRVDMNDVVVVAGEAAAGLREFARTGLMDMVATAETTWNERLTGLRERLDAITVARSALVESDPEQAAQGRRLESEHRAIAWRVGSIERVPAQHAMVDLGLLPNYTLIDTLTTLEATLTSREETDDGEYRYRSELREYPRSARIALTELAPGNHYYVQGFQHEITGLDLGTHDRPAWRQWRICSECGYMRTGSDTADTSRCPRCANERIGDVSALHDVLIPARVTARDRRDDARIRDDADERDRASYKLVNAFDIAPEAIEEGSWRLAGRTFGVDYSRRAVIRHLNVGPMHPERPDNDLLAGVETQLSPFNVCETCGGVRIDGRHYPPGGPGHHRPWCPRRGAPAEQEGHRQVILAHELRTEALRVLLPIADTSIAERGVSFAAALMAGVAEHYGGDPDHLSLQMANMPDQNTGLRRRFVVLYDTLPGGTGYLHRLADQEEFRTVLRSARRVITECRCVADGKRACHRCLLGRLDDDSYDLIDRRIAVEILDELLENWTAEPVSHTGEVSLWDQVESELERRFLRLLTDWVAGNENASLSRVTDAGGVRRADLRVTGPDGQVVHWEVRLQNTIRGTRPDVLLQRVDADPLTVAVYLDGYRWHAALDVHDRLAVDAAVREKLRADGTVVFQLIWDDIKAWPGDGDAPVWPPYSGDAQLAARQMYQRSLGGDPARLRARVWTNPVNTLLAFLADPDPDAWRRDVQGALAGLLRHPEDKAGCMSGGILPAIFTQALHEARLPPGEGPLSVVRAKDGNGCPVTLIVDRRTDTPGWTAAVTLDDHAATIEADREGHERRWAGWLYWGNLVQFLTGAHGDGHQLTVGMLEAFDATELAAARPVARAPEGTPSPARAEPSPQWRTVLELIDPDDRDLNALMRELAERGLPVPEVGFELGDGNWQAEAAWPRYHIAVVLADDGDEAERRDAAYAEAHWDVRTARHWLPDELGRRIQ